MPPHASSLHDAPERVKQIAVRLLLWKANLDTGGSAHCPTVVVVFVTETLLSSLDADPSPLASLPPSRLFVSLDRACPPSTWYGAVAKAAEGHVPIDCSALPFPSDSSLCTLAKVVLHKAKSARLPSAPPPRRRPPPPPPAILSVVGTGLKWRVKKAQQAFGLTVREGEHTNDLLDRLFRSVVGGKGDVPMLEKIVAVEGQLGLGLATAA